jgi:hypothetical protein
MKLTEIVFKNSAQIMQSTNAPRITKTKCSCGREIITVCPESNSEHVNTFCKQKAEFF